MSNPPYIGKSNISAITAKLFGLILKMPVEERETMLAELEARQSPSKRDYPRKQYFMSVQYVVNERLYDGFIKNISPTGMLIEASHEDTTDIHTGDPVILTFKHPDANEQVKVTGDIIRKDEEGIGVNFHQLLSNFLTTS
ncbi:MAG: PilZ domain-containing protein [Desulfobacterales bacterium]|nr:PilZ domain-containing protein [Desulfobacterales bacterium]